MFDSNKLRHLPFFEFAASHDERHPEWRRSMAGLVVLRLVDSWLEEGRRVLSDDEWSVVSVRASIDDVDQGTPIRALLGRIVDALERHDPDIHRVVTPLMAYGQALEYDAHWVLAADVYQTLLAHLHPVEDSDASIAAHLRLGQCYRNLNRIDDAAAAFGSAAEVASSVGDIVGVLRARIGEGRIAIIKGNLPHAEEILDDTIRRAGGAELRDVRSRALHDRSNVAHLRGQFELAIQLAYDALNQSQSQSERDRILGDIALSFLELGVYSAARDAYLIISATAQEQYTRWTATLNLLELSTRTGSETLFELYNRSLSTQTLPPHMATAYQLGLGTGYQRFGNYEKARVHLRWAMSMAEEHGFNQYLFEAEEALYQLQAPPPPLRVPAELSLDVEEVASALRELRELAGVS